MSFISKEHFSMMLKSVKKLLSQKADKSDIVPSDWNQNDETRSDFVKNRTHYDDIIVVVEATAELAGPTTYEVTDSSVIAAYDAMVEQYNGECLTITVDGVDVDCVCVNGPLKRFAQSR